MPPSRGRGPQVAYFYCYIAQQRRGLHLKKNCPEFSSHSKHTIRCRMHVVRCSRYSVIGSFEDRLVCLFFIPEKRTVSEWRGLDTLYMTTDLIIRVNARTT